ncbi:MAG: TfoX/Sxy family protein [Alphaproteobacteria bacterium]|jgi:TfoX/Sxy family transcriptional regulator of competence genes|nr:TfoX/Sxy family protein [Alphaproteobacteria bacterium]
MAAPYLAALEALLARLGPDPEATSGLDCRHFFSGAAAYIDGRIFVTLTPVGLALKLPEATRELLLAEGAEPLRYFPKAPIKKQYVVLPEALQEDTQALARLVQQSLRFVREAA